MKALNLKGIDDLVYDELPMPTFEVDEVLVKVGAAGICGSDIPRVYTKGTYHFPTVIGHEFSGTVVDTNPEDCELQGKKVSIFPLIPCYHCESCVKEQYALCSDYDYYGSRRDGGFSEFIAIKKKNLVLVPEEVSLQSAAMVEPAAVALHAIKKSGLKRGESLAIIGLGPIGFLVAQWALIYGAGTVALIARDSEKVAFAKDLGFNLAFNTKEESLDYILEACGLPEGFDVLIEGTGSEEALVQSLDLTKRLGRIVTMGNPVGDMLLSQANYWKILRKELSLIGTWNSEFNSTQNDWTESLLAMARGELKIEPLITHRFNLHEYRDAFELMRDKKEHYSKVMFIME